MIERETTLRIIKQELIDTRKQDDECQFGIALGAIYLAVSLNIITNRELHRLNKLALNASVQAKIQRHQHGAMILGKRITQFQHTKSLDGLFDGISPAPDETFQQRVQTWMLECFGQAIAADRAERNHRFLEEALELVQSLDCSADEAHRLVDYVYGRPTGEPVQEAGGVMVTLAALCLANGLDMAGAGEQELTRISQPDKVLHIREKQRSKPAMSPLPGVYPERAGPDVPLAAEHHGMRISAHGLLGRVGGRLKWGASEMLKHLDEMAARYYAGDISVVDEFLQLYDLAQKRPKTDDSGGAK